LILNKNRYQRKLLSAFFLGIEFVGKGIRLKHLSPDCKAILIKANPDFANSIISDVDDLRYYVVTEALGIVE